MHFNETHPWLYMRNGFLWCRRCQEIKAKGFEPRVKLSSEWCDGMISSQILDKGFQQKRTSEKITEHHKSHSHKRAEEMLADIEEKIKEAVSWLSNTRRMCKQLVAFSALFILLPKKSTVFLTTRNLSAYKKRMALILAGCYITGNQLSGIRIWLPTF